MFYWLEDLPTAFAEIQRVIKPDGVVLFSSLGPDSLQELRASFAQIDNNPHVNIFLDMHEIGDAMLKAGLKDPVMDVDYHKLYYPDFAELIKAIKLSGEVNYHPDRQRSLMGKHKWQQLAMHYNTFRNSSQKLPITFEVIFGHALGTAIASRANEHGEIHIPISRITKRS
jgi:malonyl-CoA O-methyltransferase